MTDIPVTAITKTPIQMSSGKWLGQKTNSAGTVFMQMFDTPEEAVEYESGD